MTDFSRSINTPNKSKYNLLMTSNTFYFLAFSRGLKCPGKIHFSTQYVMNGGAKSHLMEQVLLQSKSAKFTCLLLCHKVASSGVILRHVEKSKNLGGAGNNALRRRCLAVPSDLPKGNRYL